MPSLRLRHAPEDLEHLQNSIKRLESDPKYISAWSSVSTDVKNDLLNEHYRNLAEDLLFNALTDEKPKAKKARGRPARNRKAFPARLQNEDGGQKAFITPPYPFFRSLYSKKRCHTR